MSEPIPMLLYCPECRARHIDEGEFATKSHHTHACQSCGHVWRPAIGPTVGVQFLPGFKNAAPQESPMPTTGAPSDFPRMMMACYVEGFCNGWGKENLSMEIGVMAMQEYEKSEAKAEFDKLPAPRGEQTKTGPAADIEYPSPAERVEAAINIIPADLVHALRDKIDNMDGNNVYPRAVISAAIRLLAAIPATPAAPEEAPSPAPAPRNSKAPDNSQEGAI